MKSFEYDLGYLQAVIVVIEDYLLVDELFWPINASPPEGEPAFPQLTLGGMLLAEARLKALPVNRSQEEQRLHILSELERARAKWRVNWEKKAQHSLSVRLRMWADFLEEYRSNPQDNAGRYRYEVRLRVMLELLSRECGEVVPAERESLAGLDLYLRGELEMGGFIWEPEVQSSFPREPFWYLYGLLHSASWRGGGH